jgi:uncharacterized protein
MLTGSCACYPLDGNGRRRRRSGMTEIRVDVSDDAALAARQANGFLCNDPVAHNVLLTILRDRSAAPEPGRYWWALEAEAVVGFALQSPPTFSLTLAPSRPAVAHALADYVHSERPQLPGVIGEAGTASAFAGRWTECSARPASPRLGQRIYELDELRTPPGVPGALRPAADADRHLLLAWVTGFAGETQAVASPPAATLERLLGSGRLGIWDDGVPRSMAMVNAPVGGVGRVGYVYTPLEHRGHGYAAACVAAAVEHALSTDTERCILYTELENPTSNGIYRRLGFRAVSEVLAYRFG